LYTTVILAQVVVINDEIMDNGEREPGDEVDESSDDPVS
jgi:hypothetical protein